MNNRQEGLIQFLRRFANEQNGAVTPDFQEIPSGAIIQAADRLATAGDLLKRLERMPRRNETDFGVQDWTLHLTPEFWQEVKAFNGESDGHTS